MKDGRRFQLWTNTTGLASDIRLGQLEQFKRHILLHYYNILISQRVREMLQRFGSSQAA